MCSVELNFPQVKATCHRQLFGEYAGITWAQLNPGLTQNLKQIFEELICKLEIVFS